VARGTGEVWQASTVHNDRRLRNPVGDAPASNSVTALALSGEPIGSSSRTRASSRRPQQSALCARSSPAGCGLQSTVRRVPAPGAATWPGNWAEGAVSTSSAHRLSRSRPSWKSSKSAPLNHLLRPPHHGWNCPGREAAGNPATGPMRLEASAHAGMLQITFAMMAGHRRRESAAQGSERGQATIEMAARRARPSCSNSSSARLLNMPKR